MRRAPGNLARARKAAGFLANELQAALPEAESGSSHGTRNARRKPRRELRKELRVAKKARRVPKPKLPLPTGDDVTEMSTPQDSSGTRGDGALRKRKRKRTKAAEAPSDTVTHEEGNEGFFQLLRARGLVEDGKGDKPVLNDDEDAEIEHYGRLLKKQKSHGNDAVDYILSFKDEAYKENGLVDGADPGDLYAAMETAPDHGSDDEYATDEHDVDEDQESSAEDIEQDQFKEFDDFEDGDDNSEQDEEASEDGNAGSDASERAKTKLSATGAAKDTDRVDSEEEIEEGTTQYITRAEAFGDNMPGKQLQATYVPPARRAGCDHNLQSINRKVRGTLNRLNASNFSVLLPEVESGFARFSRNDMSECMTTFILDAALRKDRALQHLLIVYAACVSGLQQLVGMEVAAHFVQELATKFEQHYTRVAPTSNDSETVDKECTNLVLLFGYLFQLQVIDETLLFDLARKFCETLNALDVELLVGLLSVCGPKLRSADPLALKEVTTIIGQKAATANGSVKPRVRFMLDVITDLKHNRRKFAQDANADEAALLLKVIRGMVAKRGTNWRDPLRVPLKDLLASQERGRWWLVGSAWVGRHNDRAALTGAVPVDPANAAPATEQGATNASAELLDLAAQQRMNTDLRKKIFCTVMACDDYLDAFEKLLKLKLKAKQDREIIHVLVDCCLQERNYNPFYGLLLVKLCQHSQNHKVTLQYAFWDQFKKTEKIALRQASHLARLLTFVVSNSALSLAILKVIEFERISENNLLVLRLIFVHLLTHNPEETVVRVFDRISNNAELYVLRTSLVMLLRHYVRNFVVALGDGGARAGSLTGAQKEELLRVRCKKAKQLLMRGVEGAV